MKKIVTVSVLAIMAVSAANADIASTTYVDKAKTAVEGQVNTLAGRVTTAEGEITTAEGKISTLEGTVAEHTTSIAKNAEDIETNAKAIKNINDGQLNIGAGTIAKSQLTTELQTEINGAASGVSTNAGEIATIKSTMATDEDLKAVSKNLTDNYSTTAQMNAAIGKGTLTVTIDGAEAGTFNANAAENGTIAITVPSTYAKTADVASTYATKDALSGVTTNLSNNYYTKDAANAEFYNEDEVKLAINTAVADGGAVKNVIDGALANYSTTAQMEGELDKKIDKSSESSLNVATAVKAEKDASGNVITATYATKKDLTDGLNTKLADTETGSATLPIYIDDKGVAQTITSYSGNAATATTASDYASTGGIKDKFDGVDASLAKVAAFGTIPTVPATCAETNADGELTRDCTLVMKYNASTNAVTPEWEVIAR